LSKVYRLPKLPVLEMEDLPSFQELDHDNFGDVDSRVNVGVTITTGVSDTKRTEYEYFLSSLSVTGGTFTNNYAFGAGLSAANGGAGGAIFMSFCSASFTYSSKNADNFYQNKASVGGAIAALYSNVMCQNAKFTSNEAWKFAGAVYLQGFENPENGSVAILSWQFVNVDFTTNTASEIGGAIVATAGLQLYCQTVLFSQNTAGISGGSCYIINTACKFFDSDFMNNKAGIDANRKGIKGVITKLNRGTLIGHHIGGRGGGAIYFMSNNHYNTSKTETSSKQRLLYTQSCCFSGNIATNGFDFGRETISPGNIIMFNGLCRWYSRNDYVADGAPHIGHVTTQWGTSTLLKQFYNDSELSDPCGGSTPTYETQTASSISRPTPDRYQELTHTSIPTPTRYIYSATPITQLPYATTKSWTQYSPSTVITPYQNTLTILPPATPMETPASTPKSTPETPEETPEETPTFMPTPVETLEPTIKPSSTFLPTPLPSPSTPVMTPAKTPKETPMETPMETISPSKSAPPPAGKVYSLTYVKRSLSYVSTFETVSYSWSETTNEEGGFTSVQISTMIVDSTVITTETIVPSDIEIAAAAEGGNAGEEEGGNLVVVVAAVVSGIILIVIIALLVWFFVGYSKSSSSSDSVVEMDEETVLHVPDSTSAPITNDNPLWTTSVMGDTDDPFRNDFEEVAAEGFFNERAETVDSDP
jgi:hypothetical protein